VVRRRRLALGVLLSNQSLGLFRLTILEHARVVIFWFIDPF
jgi:hypothetical protein